MADTVRTARFRIGQVVRHRLFPFRGVIFDVDPTFANTEEWWESIPAEVRPHKVKRKRGYNLAAAHPDNPTVACAMSRRRRCPLSSPTK
jgi:heat shock protein HspQ